MEGMCVEELAGELPEALAWEMHRSGGFGNHLFIGLVLLIGMRE